MKKYILGLAMALCASTAAMAEVSVSGGADIVSAYTWRGIQQSGPAIQPGMSISAGNFTLGAWGSSAFDVTSTTSKELDFTLGYEVGKFSIAVTDYWWSGEGCKYFDNSHQYEVTAGFAITDDLSVAWSTVVGGNIDKDGDGEQMYSSYLNVAYAFEIGSVACDASLGINPYESAYGDSFGISSVALRFTKEIVCTDKFSLPLFVETSIAPLQANAYLLAGMSFGF